MSLRFSSEVLENAILSYQLRTEEPLDEVVLACLLELKELRGRLTCNDFNNGYNQALDDFERELLKWCNKERLADEDDIMWIKKRVRKDRIDEQSDN